MTAQSENSYDEIPYLSYPFPQSHPDNLCTIATLFALKPPPVRNCRVLEIGCAAGGNIIPLAEQYPDSRFLGIDLSEVEIREARETISALKYTNVECRCQNILDFESPPESFDYIISHGVFSWVPRNVQERILDICGTCLSPSGIAYISYNTLPGWRMRAIIRDMMCFHGNRFADAKSRVQQARAVLTFLATNSPEDTPYGKFLRSEAKMLQSHSDWYLFHEHLEETNDPVYFQDMVLRAQKHGLQFLGEADVGSMYAGHLPKPVAQTLERTAKNLVEMEQYVDFLRNRTFRQTLFCRAGLEINRGLTASTLSALYVSSPVTLAAGVTDIFSSSPTRFTLGASRRVLEVSRPVQKCALAILRDAWPGALLGRELEEATVARLASQQKPEAPDSRKWIDELGRFLLEGFLAGFIEFRTTPPGCLRKVAPKPLASPLARFQAARSGQVTNCRHQTVPLDDFGRALLPILDGTRDRAAIYGKVFEQFRKGVLISPVPNVAEQADPSETPTWIQDITDKALARTALSALLVESNGDSAVA